MRLLLDTHILLAITANRLAATYPDAFKLVGQEGNKIFVSVASLWEIAIKHRLGKLDLHIALADMDGYLRVVGFGLLDICLAHVLSDALPEPPTRDPFDRLLLAQCNVEGMRLLTMDRSLADHWLSARS